MIELVKALCVSVEAEAMTEQSYSRMNSNEKYLNPVTDLCLETTPALLPSCSYDLRPWNLTPKGQTKISSLTGSSGASQRSDGQKFHSKNLITERNRRCRINDALLQLRALVPRITRVCIVGKEFHLVD